MHYRWAFYIKVPKVQAGIVWMVQCSITKKSNWKKTIGDYRSPSEGCKRPYMTWWRRTTLFWVSRMKHGIAVRNWKILRNSSTWLAKRSCLLKRQVLMESLGQKEKWFVYRKFKNLWNPRILSKLEHNSNQAIYYFCKGNNFGFRNESFVRQAEYHMVYLSSSL